MKPVDYRSLTPTKRRDVREKYIVFQQNKCLYCKALLSEKPRKDVFERRVRSTLFPTGFFKWPIHLHHSHATGLTLGAVHAHCNAVLWQFHGE